MRFTLLIALAGCALRADVVTLTSTRSSSIQSCGNFQGCTPFDLFIPQFDPARGTPNSITWTFADSQNYYGGYNDIGATDFGEFTWTTTEGDSLGFPLGVEVSNSQNLSATINPQNTRNVSFGGWWASGVVQANGVVTDSSAWIGPGEVAIQVTPFLFASEPQGIVADQVRTNLASVTNDVAFTITADYTPVPEPNHAILLCLASVFLGYRFNRRKPKLH